MSGNGKVALVTGASAGIGKASALALLKEGYNVVLTARRLELLEKAIAGFGRARGAGARGADPTSAMPNR